MSESITIVNIKEDKTHVLLTFDKVNSVFLEKLEAACIASDRGFEFDGVNIVKFKHLTSKTYAESQARKLIRETLATMPSSENAEKIPSNINTPPIKNNTQITTLSNGVSGEVIVTDIRMPFLSMVIFMIKWAIAAIPAFIILFVISLIFTALFGGIFGSRY